MRSRGLARAAKIIVGGSAALAVLAALALGGLWLRLTFGPIEVDDLGTRVADTLTKRFDGSVIFSFGSTRIANAENGPTIMVDRLKVEAAGRTVVEAPRAELSLDPVALLKFEALPRRFEIFDLVVRLLVMPDGALAISAGGPNENAIVLGRPGSQAAENEAAPPPRRTALLREAGGALRAFFDLATSPKSPLAAIHLVAVRGGKLIVDDRSLGRTTSFSNLEMAFEKGWRSTSFSLRAKGPNGELATVAKATGTPETERRLDLETKGVSMDEIALVAGLRRLLVDTDARLAFQMRFVLEPNRELREASGRVAVGAGYVRLEDPDHEPLFFDEITGAFHWDRVNRRIVLGPLQFFAGETQFVAQGALDPPLRPEDGWKVALGLSKPGGFAPERPDEKFLQIEKANLEGRLSLDKKKFEIERAEIVGPEVSAAAAGSIDWVEGPRVRLGLSLGRMPLRATFRVWPSHMGAPARTWMIGHAHGGVIESAKLSVDFDKNALLAMRFDRPPPDNSMQADFKVTGGSLTAAPGIPDLTAIDGDAHLTGRTAAFKIASGTMQLSARQKLTLAGGAFEIPRNDGSRATPARVDVHVVGSVDAVSELLAKDAIKDYASMPLEPGSLKGQVDGQLRLDFKVGPDARGDDVKVFVNASVANFSAEHLLGKEKFESGTLTVVGDPTGLRATGTGRMFGAAATLDLRKNVGEAATANLSATLDDAARTRIGVEPPGVAGPVAMKLAATLGDRETQAKVDLDLARTAFDNPVPGLVKPAGRPARATFQLTQRDKTTKIDNLVIDAGGLSAKGSIDLTNQGELQAVRLTQVRLSPGDDMRVDVQRAGDGYKATVRGATIDARPFLKSVTQSSGSQQKGADFDLDLKTPILTGFSKQALVNADLKMVRKSGSMRQFAMSGQFGHAAFSARMANSEGGAPQVVVSSGDAGALLAFTDLYARMEGGKLEARISLNDSSAAGTVQINSFHLRDEPALRRLVVESNPRAETSGTQVDPALVAFNRLQVVFLRSGGQLTLRDGVMNGPNIGLTVEGSVDTDHNAIALRGTFIPAFTVNNFFSKIPVVGMLLGGGWNEGLFAVNYKINGKANAPQVSVNPLTVAPGFLRKIFGALDTITDAPQQNAPARTDSQ